MRFSKEKADVFIAELAAAKNVLAVGRLYGIRIEVDASATQALSQSDHPSKMLVLENLLITSH